MTPSQRADARRNRARILAVAEQEVAANGADASLERIARVAGVGSATVRRHFPTRHALLEAVSHHRVQALAARARVHAGADPGVEAGDPGAALRSWLDELAHYAVTARGLAAAMAYDAGGADPVGDSCSAQLVRAAAPLVDRAHRSGGLMTHVTAEDLLVVVVGLTLATEHHPDPHTRVRTLLRTLITGLTPAPTATG